jgi:hypothetical protein
LAIVYCALKLLLALFGEEALGRLWIQDEQSEDGAPDR